MAFSKEQFEDLVRKLEVTSQANPKRYRLRVALLAMLGYAYIFLMLGICLAMLAGLIVLEISGHGNVALIKVVIILLILIGTILRSMWVKFETPEGIPLTRQHAPALFDMVDGVSKKLAAPRFHHVLLVDDFNAAVAQIPKLGIFGWQVNYLLLGLPLMQSLSPEEFESVVAHEMGHLSGNHSRFLGWIYRVRRTWLQLLGSLAQQKHKGAALFTSFFQWYAPYFSAYSFVLARVDEYEADRCAAQVAGARTAASALMRIPVQGRLLNDVYWPGIFEQSLRTPEPPVGVFAGLIQAVQKPVDQPTMQRWVDGALYEKTDVDDTHPSLTDRLAALGFVAGYNVSGDLQPLPVDIRPVTSTAADRFLGSSLPGLTAHMDEMWRQAVMSQWRKQFSYAQQAASRLQELYEKSRTQPLTVDEQFNYAKWTAELSGNQQAFPLLAHFTSQFPSHIAGQFLYGQCLLEEKDESGIPYLEKAMGLNPELTVPACGLIYKFLHDQGRFDDADRYLNRARGRRELEIQSREERSTISPRDAYIPHNLDADGVAYVASTIASEKDVAEAYLVCKAQQVLNEKPLYVVGLVVKPPWFKVEGENFRPELVQRVARSLLLPGKVFVVALDKNYAPALPRMRAIPGSLIYRRGRK